MQIFFACHRNIDPDTTTRYVDANETAPINDLKSTLVFLRLNMCFHKGGKLDLLICLFNLIFLMTGCAISGIGIYLGLEMSNYYYFIGTPKSLPALILSPIAINIFGALVSFYSILAFCSWCTSDGNRCQLCIFAVLMGLILVAEISIVSLLFIYKENTNEVFKDAMEKDMASYTEEQFEGDRQGWNSIQNDFKCCGIENHTDWKFYNMKVPDSCCSSQNTKICEEGEFWKGGCLTLLGNFMRENCIIYCVVGAVIIMVQLIDVISAFLLATNIGSKERYIRTPNFQY
jgi:hypothetical protein